MFNEIIKELPIGLLDSIDELDPDKTWSVEEFDGDELKRLKDIEKRWHALSEKIAKFYINEEGEPFEDEEGGNLCDIGEAAASAFGWL